MAKLVTVVVNTATVTLSSSLFGAMANCVAIVNGAVNNTNIENLMCSFITQGLREIKDRRLGHGEAGAAGLTHSYIETNVKGNSE